MKIPIPLNDLDRAVLTFQRSQAVVPELLRHLCAGNLYLLIPFHPEVANRHNPAGVENIFGRDGQPLRAQESVFIRAHPRLKIRSRGWRGSRFKTTPHPVCGHLPLPAKRGED